MIVRPTTSLVIHCWTHRHPQRPQPQKRHHVVDRELVEEPAASLGKGEVIAAGVNPKLDEVRRLAFHSQEALDAVRNREAEATGISGLKIAFNNVFGYYLEVRNAHKDKVPEEWIRKQTLTQAERYITEVERVGVPNSDRKRTSRNPRTCFLCFFGRGLRRR